MHLSGRPAAEKPDDLAPLQLIECHRSVPRARAGLKDIYSAGISHGGFGATEKDRSNAISRIAVHAVWVGDARDTGPTCDIACGTEIGGAA